MVDDRVDVELSSGDGSAFRASTSTSMPGQAGVRTV